MIVEQLLKCNIVAYIVEQLLKCLFVTPPLAFHITLPLVILLPCRVPPDIGRYIEWLKAQNKEQAALIERLQGGGGAAGDGGGGTAGDSGGGTAGDGGTECAVYTDLNMKLSALISKHYPDLAGGDSITTLDALLEGPISSP